MLHPFMTRTVGAGGAEVGGACVGVGIGVGNGAGVGFATGPGLCRGAVDDDEVGAAVGTGPGADVAAGAESAVGTAGVSGTTVETGTNEPAAGPAVLEVAAEHEATRHKPDRAMAAVTERMGAHSQIGRSPSDL